MGINVIMLGYLIEFMMHVKLKCLRIHELMKVRGVPYTFFACDLCTISSKYAYRVSKAFTFVKICIE